MVPRAPSFPRGRMGIQGVHELYFVRKTLFSEVDCRNVWCLAQLHRVNYATKETIGLQVCNRASETDLVIGLTCVVIDGEIKDSGAEGDEGQSFILPP